MTYSHPNDCAPSILLEFARAMDERYVSAVLRENVYGFGRSILITPVLSAPKPKRAPKIREWVPKASKDDGEVPTLAMLLAKTSTIHKVALHELRGPSLKRRVAWPRQHFMSMAAEHGYSTAETGKFLCRDHSTVVHGIEAHRSRAERDQ